MSRQVTVSTPVRLEVPTPDDIAEFVADPVPAQPGHFAGFAVTLTMMKDILRDYHNVGQDRWSHHYHHIAMNDRTGHFVTRDGMKVDWMVRPGGLATLEFRDGTILYLAAER